MKICSQEYILPYIATPGAASHIKGIHFKTIWFITAVDFKAQDTIVHAEWLEVKKKISYKNFAKLQLMNLASNINVNSGSTVLRKKFQLHCSPESTMN
jgi:hypothetical protein